ncbi:MAG: hypothetical protein ACPGUV_12935, partial [Polyangiales bacterium]
MLLSAEALYRHPQQAAAAHPTPSATLALAEALQRAGSEVTLVAPLWRSLDPEALSLARRLAPVPLSFSALPLTPPLNAATRLLRFDGRTAAGVTLVLLAHPEHFGMHADLQTATDPDLQCTLGLLFALGAAAVLDDVLAADACVHGWGWPGALALLAGEARGLELAHRSVLSFSEADVAVPLPDAFLARRRDAKDSPPETATGATAPMAGTDGGNMAAAAPAPAEAATSAVVATVSQAAHLCAATPADLSALQQAWTALHETNVPRPVHVIPPGQSAGAGCGWLSPAPLAGTATDAAAWHAARASQRGQLQLDWGLPLTPRTTLVGWAPYGDAATMAEGLAVLPDILEHDVQVVVLAADADGAWAEALQALQDDWPGQVWLRTQDVAQA